MSRAALFLPAFSLSAFRHPSLFFPSSSSGKELNSSPLVQFHQPVRIGFFKAHGFKVKFDGDGGIDRGKPLAHHGQLCIFFDFFLQLALFHGIHGSDEILYRNRTPAAVLWPSSLPHRGCPECCRKRSPISPFQIDKTVPASVRSAAAWLRGHRLQIPKFPAS